MNFARNRSPIVVRSDALAHPIQLHRVVQARLEMDPLDAGLLDPLQEPLASREDKGTADLVERLDRRALHTGVGNQQNHVRTHVSRQ